MTFATATTRRRFLSNAALCATATLLHPRAWAADTLDPRVADIVASTMGIDTHNHVDVPLTEADMPGPDIDLTGDLKQSGLTAICMTFATDYQPGDAYQRFLHAFASYDRQLARNHIQRSLSAADIRSAHAEHRPAVVQAIEGGHFLQGHIERVEEAYHRGLRLLCLLHDRDATPPLGDVYTNPPQFGGLTSFGAQVIKECNRLGILIDLTHCSVQTLAAAIKLSTRPVVFSHTGLDTQLGSNARMAQMMRPRLISKEQARLIASSGGLIGVWTHLSDTPLEYAQNISAMADIVGIDHVCIGTDTKLTTPTPRPGGPPPSGAAPGGPPPGGPPPGMPHIGERTNLAWSSQTAGFYPTVVDAMLKTGFTPDDIAKIGGANFLRVFAASSS